MMRGRRPTPTALRRAQGNPGKRGYNAAEPTPPDGLPECPPHLSNEAQAEWQRLARTLYNMGVLTTVDRGALAAYCQAWGRWVEAEEKLRDSPALLKTPSGYVQQNPWLSISNKQLELMGRFMVELGLTPSSRSRVEALRGTKADRPELLKALHLAKVTGATLVIAKLDRLSRNAAFLLALRDSGVRFVAVDMPKANDLTVGLMALVAQAEREAISRRTKEALAVAKARGVRLGNPNGAASLRRAGKGAVALRKAVSANADAFAADLAAVVADIRANGAVSLRAVAAELTARGIRTRRGGAWGVGNVRGLMRRLAE